MILKYISPILYFLLFENRASPEEVDIGVRFGIAAGYLL